MTTALWISAYLIVGAVVVGVALGLHDESKPMPPLWSMAGAVAIWPIVVLLACLINVMGLTAAGVKWLNKRKGERPS